MNVQADYRQVVGEVKERNRLYRALLEIKEIALSSSSIQDLEESKNKLREIFEKCEKALDIKSKQ